MNKTERFNGLDGLRVISMIGILVMHVLANVYYQNNLSNLYSYVVHFGKFTSLFMLLSAFSVNCGYYEKVQNDWNNIEVFYKKRFAKLLPFFAFITILDVILNFSKESIFEGFANLTLVFGFIPHESITVVGVGWTLGVIFVFYLLYPFFVFLMKDKRRFYIGYSISLIYTFIVNNYFGIGKVDFLYCASYFMLGCLIYLQKNRIMEVFNKKIVLLMIIITTFIYYYSFFNGKILLDVILYILFALITIYALLVSNNTNILTCRSISWLSGISFEIYLCHMLVYRVIEKFNLLHVFSNDLLSYFTVCLMTLVGSIVLAYTFKICLNKLLNKLGKR